MNRSPDTVLSTTLQRIGQECLADALPVGALMHPLFHLMVG